MSLQIGSSSAATKGVFGSLTVGTNSSTLLTNNYRVGILNSNPGYALDVSGGDVNIGSNWTYRIAGVSVLNSTTLGGNIISSSLTSVGTLTSLTVGGNIVQSSGTATCYPASTGGVWGTTQTTYYNKSAEDTTAYGGLKVGVEGTSTTTGVGFVDAIYGTSASECKLSLRTQGTERVNLSSSQISSTVPVQFSNTTGQKLNLYSTTYGMAISDNQQNYRVPATGTHIFYTGGTNNDGTEYARINYGGMKVTGTVTAPSIKLGDFSSTWQPASGTTYSLPSTMSNGSNGGAGYYILPGNLCIQWGVGADSAAPQSWTFQKNLKYVYGVYLGRCDNYANIENGWGACVATALLYSGTYPNGYYYGVRFDSIFGNGTKSPAFVTVIGIPY